MLTIFLCVVLSFFFFFSSRRRHTRSLCDWSSDVCSSDLLAAGYTLLHNEHVRIDVLYGYLPARARAWIDLLGSLFFLLPMALIIMVLSWPLVEESYLRHEYSSDAGGLLRWPVKILIPIGFLLLVLQA